ncbi:MAG: sensor histidine kinase [Cyclobacteriaceae bacterium]
MEKSHKIGLHILFWIIFQGMYWGRQVYILLIQNLEVDACFYVDKGAELLVHLIHFYIFYFFIFPRYFLKNFKSISIPLLLMFLVAVFYFRAYVNILVFNQYGMRCGFSECDSYIVHWFHVVNTFVVTSLSALVYVAISWVSVQKQKIALTTQNRASELALLRAQINPHFLFNTLNNIYYLASTKSDNAGAAIIRLSEIMRYMIKEANAEKVTLEKEIDYIQGLIDLQRLRMENSTAIELNISGKVLNQKIAPMLLISFVENAFKHGTNELSTKGVMINLGVDDHVLSFRVLNYYDPDHNVEESGFGLKNVKKRLELIYPDRFDLQILDYPEERKFEIKLTLRLKDGD